MKEKLDIKKFYVNNQKELEEIFNLPKEELKYSNVFFGSGEYVMSKIPSEYVGFFRKPTENVRVKFEGNIDFPSDIFLIGFACEGGKLHIGKRNWIGDCRFEKTVIDKGCFSYCYFMKSTCNKQYQEKLDMHRFHGCLFINCVVEKANVDLSPAQGNTFEKEE